MEGWGAKAKKMVLSQITPRGVSDPGVIDALMNVPRHLFVPESLRIWAYEDTPLPIGCAQTISQPYMVALMTSLLEIVPGMKVLEIGTGSGYQAAVLGYMGAEVHSIERVRSLATSSSKILKTFGFKVKVHYGDGNLGIPHEAPFDRILVTAAADSIPNAIIGQAKKICRIVIPISSGGGVDRLLTLMIDGKIHSEQWGDYCRFVPLLDTLSE
ncbi:MAG: protein-L-isoaspartate(D-aspartate) O-methyltransferase [Thermovirgaceae bacterium]|nr:protein-L-isoaspartate(D-aspartate) O-methyltransferase [Thermovirgaceae bacterium]